METFDPDRLTEEEKYVSKDQRRALPEFAYIDIDGRIFIPAKDKEPGEDDSVEEVAPVENADLLTKAANELFVPYAYKDFRTASVGVHRHPFTEETYDEESLSKILVNIPKKDFLKGVQSRGELALCSFDCVAAIRFGSGTVYFYSPRSEAFHLTQNFEFDEKGLEAEMDRVQKEEKEAEQTKFEVILKENHTLRTRLTQLMETLDKEDEKKKPKQAEQARGEFDFDEVDSPDHPLVKDFAKAVNLPFVNKGIPKWSADDSVSGRQWLKAAIKSLRDILIAKSIMHRILSSKLGVEEKVAIDYAMSVAGEENYETFIACFLKTYGTKESPVSLLRKVTSSIMLTDTANASDYMGFMGKLKEKAHEGYEGFGVDKSHWALLDKITVGIGYINAVPEPLKNHLLLSKAETLEEMVNESITWQRAKDEAQRSKDRYIATSGKQNSKGGNDAKRSNNSGKNSHNKGNKKAAQRSAVCAECAKLTPAPQSCDHCQRCGKEGHWRDFCRAKIK